MRHKHRFILSALALAVFPVFASSQVPSTPPTTRVQERTSFVRENEEQRTRDAAPWEAWGLTTEEWSRYRQLMQGPLGIHSPNIDPLTALGIESRDEEERSRYAELQVRVEAARVEKLFAYQRAYTAAWQRLFPGLPRVNSLTSLESRSEAEPGPSSRLAVFVKADCPPCETRVKKLQSSSTAFDLYLVESHNDDERIRRWASRAGIDPGKVRARTITLNHDGGRWKLLGLSGDLPAVLRKVNGQWRRQ